ncbi:replication protein [Bacillus cereus]|uniref:replication protein n=1 Tax=Bacillus cereus TaxID=1396 RepID=UPI002ABED335|nr:replication protein [Bacillus cereus]MDZ4567460.1 replication protein [Bacillus cereus]
MAGGRIKGITISIDGETTGLQNALKDVNKQSEAVSKELKDVERLLKFNPGNVEALAQKQKLLTQQIENTTQKLDKLKAAEQQVQAQFQNGKISEEQYRAFRREIEFTEGSLNGLKNKLGNMKAEQENAARSTRQLETLFHATGKSVDDFAGALGNRLVNAIKNGTATSKQLDDAISKIGKEALGASTDIDKMKKVLSSVDDGASLKSVKQELNNVAKEAKKTANEVNDLNVELENMLGAAAAGAGIGKALETALDTSKLKTKIDISFNVPEESKKSVEEAVRGIEAYGVDGEAALEGVRRQWALNKDVSDEANASMVKGAATIAQSYSGIDFTELIQEVNEIGNELGISQEGALGMTSALLKIGFPPEQLDIIAEYGGQLTRAGYQAEEVQAIMEAGVETGTWNIDNLLDGLKEGRIKAAEFGQGVDKSMKEALEGTKISADQLEKWGQSVAKGGKEGSAAMTEIAKAVDGIDDATKRNEIGVKVFGTIYEDQGQNITNTLIGAQEKVIDFKNNQDQLNESVKKLDASPSVMMQQAMADLKIALEPVLLVIAQVVGKIAEWIQNNPTLAATITVIATAIGIVMAALVALTPILLLVTTEALTFAGVMAVLTSPITLVVAAVAALIAIFVLFGDKIMAIYNEYLKPTVDQMVAIINETLKPVFEKAFTIIKDIVQDAFVIIQRVWNEILSPVFSVIGSIIQNVLLPAFKFVFSAIGSVVSDAFDGIKVVWNTVLKPILNGIIDFISGVFSGDWDKAWKGVVQIFDGVFNGIKAAAKAPINAVISMINGLIKGINSIEIPDWVPGIGGGKASISTIPMLATGGKPVGNGSFIAGEAGPELFTKRGSSITVTPLSSSERSLGITGTMGKIVGDMSYSMASSMKELSGLKSVISNVYGSMASSTQAMSRNASQSNVDGNSSNSNGSISYNFERMFEGATFPIREEADIKKLAVELGKYIKTSGRKVGQL